MTTHVKGLAELVNQYDLFLLDQFGVLHDGYSPYPSAVNTLKQLAGLKKSVVIISNSGKRSSINQHRMNKIGIDASLYDQMITSGDVAHYYLTNKLAEKTTQTCFLIARDNDSSAIEELDVKQVSHPADAQLIIISGSEGDRLDESHYRELLKSSALHNTLCLCTNPDKKMLTPDGIKYGAGRIAEIYEELGGEVHWIGKPHAAIYRHVLSLYRHVAKTKVLCVGDSIEHDIAGGNNSGLQTLLVRTGIANPLSEEELLAQFERYGATPDYIASELRM